MSVITPPRTPKRGQQHRNPQAPVRTQRAATALLDRPQTPSRLQPTPTRRFQRRLGSQQVVSVRGRRVVVEKANPHRTNLAIGIVVLIMFAIAAAMLLSGKSTEQAFHLQELNAQEQQLDNQLETLNRDVEATRAAAEVARVAADHKMVVAEQPGILAVEKDGAITEQRPSDPAAVRPIIDVNGAQSRPQQASSNPNEIKAVTENIQPIPQNGATVPGVAPYAPRARGAGTSGME
ncbi:hypothetical protein WG915_09685 [Corynebacterium sp. H128]|uniref:hypothetical protein n=1 Tax=Corynebacterium sp. H128 TaxID=3133427 RepID=UPI00309649FB